MYITSREQRKIMKPTIFKLNIIGDGGVGKTALIHRFTHDDFQTEMRMTIGVDFRIKDHVLDGGDQIKVQIWDLGGPERFNFIRSMYYKGSHGSLVIFDIQLCLKLLAQLSWIH